MVLQTTGKITLGDIANEFGGTVPHKMSEYFGAAIGVPGTGVLRISNFYGKANNPDPPTWVTATDLGVSNPNTSFSRSITAYSDSPVTLSSISTGFGSFSSSGNVGTISGTAPNVSRQSYSWTIRATDQELQTTDRTFTVLVSQVPTFSTLIGTNLGTYSTSSSFGIYISASSDSTVQYSITSSPGYGSINSSNGYLSGTTPSFGTILNWTVRATDAESQTADRTFSMTVVVPVAAYWATNAYNFNSPYNGNYIDVGSWSYGSYFYVDFSSYARGTAPFIYSQQYLFAFTLSGSAVSGYINFGPGAAYWLMYVGNAYGGQWVTVGINVV